MQNRLALIFILATVAIDSIGIGIIFPVMPDLMRDVTGASLADAALWGGVLATAFAAMQFLCGPVVGNLSDRFGRRPVMLAALATMALDYLVMALAHASSRGRPRPPMPPPGPMSPTSPARTKGRATSA